MNRLLTLQGQICGMAITDGHVITSGCDGKVKLWDLSTGNFIRNLASLKHKYLTNITISDQILVGVLHTLCGSRSYHEIYTLNFEKSAKNLGKKSKPNQAAHK